MIVLDTNVISELVRPAPNPSVLTRIRGFRDDELSTTSITEAELRRGLAEMPAGRVSTGLRQDLETMLEHKLGGRVLPFDSAAAKIYAVIIARRRAAGRPISAFDAQIAAIVRANRATLVTRDTRDFENCGFEVINPWK